MPPITLGKRFILGDGYYDNTDSPWYEYGRWILLAVIIFIAVLFIGLLQSISCRRARYGARPITGTGWMVPPSYYQSQQQQNEQDAVPLYKKEAGQGDAGHFDQYGNFIPYHAPLYKHDSDAEVQYSPTPGPPPSEGPDEYAPPSRPSPAHSSSLHYEDAGPPPGPPPSASDYYNPLHDSPTAPAPARKN